MCATAIARSGRRIGSRPRGVSIALLLVCLFAGSGCGVLDPGADDDSPVIWSVPETNASRQQPYADQDLVVFTLQDRRVVALRSSTGARLWTTRLPGTQPGGIWGALPSGGTILAWGDLILVSGWDLYALDRATGAIRWTFAPADFYPATSGIALAGDAVISTGGGEGYLYSVDAATGTLRWRADLDERPFSPIVTDNVVYVGGRAIVDEHGGLGVGHLWAVDAETGAVIWGSWVGDSTLKFLDGVIGPAAVAGDLVVAAGESGSIMAFDRATGETRWRSNAEGGYSAGVAVIGSVAVIVNWSGDVTGLDVASGAIRWEDDLGSVVRWRLTTGGGMAFLNPGAVYAYTPNGQRAWSYGGRSVQLYFTTPAVYDNGVVYVAANHALVGETGGGLFALRVGE